MKKSAPQPSITRFFKRLRLSSAWQIILAIIIALVIGGTGVYAAHDTKAATPADCPECATNIYVR